MSVITRDQPHPAPYYSTDIFTPDAGSIASFLFIANMFSFIATMNNLAVEWESGMRGYLLGGGMSDVAYWLSYVAFEFGMGLATSLSICCSGELRGVGWDWGFSGLLDGKLLYLVIYTKFQSWLNVWLHFQTISYLILMCVSESRRHVSVTLQSTKRSVDGVCGCCNIW